MKFITPFINLWIDMKYRSFLDLLLVLPAAAILGCGGGGGGASEPPSPAPTAGTPSNLNSSLGLYWCSVVLSWSPAQGYAVYEVQGKRQTESTWLPLGATGLTKFIINSDISFPGLAELETLEFRVLPLGTDGQRGTPSPTYTFVVPPKPVSGLNYAFIPATDTIRLSWDPPSSATTSLDVYRVDDSHRKTLVRRLPTSTTYVDDPDWLEGSSLNYFVVSNHDGMAGFSSGFITAGSLHAPKDFQVTSGPGKITLAWNSTSTLATSIQVYRTANPNPTKIDESAQALIATLPVGTTSFTDFVPFGVYGYQFVNVASTLSGKSAQACGVPLMATSSDLLWSVPELRILPEGEITPTHFSDPNQWVIREHATYGRIFTHGTDAWAPVPLPADFRDWASPVVVDNSGRIHALYHPVGSDFYFPALRHGVYTSTGWVSTTLANSTGGSGHPTLQVSPSGSLWVAWADWGGSPISLQTYKIRGWSDGTWGPESLADLMSTNYGNKWEMLQFYPDASGMPLLGYSGYSQVGYAQQEAQGWITHELPPLNPRSLRAGSSSFATGSDRQVFAAGLIGTSGETVVELEAQSGIWGTPQFPFGGDDPNNSYECTPIASSLDGTQLAYCTLINPKSSAGGVPRCQLRYCRNGSWTTYDLPAFGAILQCHFDAQNKLVLTWKISTNAFPQQGDERIQTAIHVIVHL